MIVQKRGDRTNFADKNNVVLGWDSSTNCCEDHGWFIVPYETIMPGAESEYDDLTPYNFDTAYFEEIDAIKRLDSGGMIRFRLVADGLPDLFLHLYNLHNGYYSHGFSVQRGESMLREGHL